MTPVLLIPLALVAFGCWRLYVLARRGFLEWLFGCVILAACVVLAATFLLGALTHANLS